MKTHGATQGGFLGSLRMVLDGLWAGAGDRIALISLELEEEQRRQIRTVAWLSALVFTGIMALSFATVTLVCLFWESARLRVLGALGLFYLGIFVLLVFAFRRFLARQPRPFDATLHSLEGDRQCIRGEK